MDSMAIIIIVAHVMAVISLWIGVFTCFTQARVAITSIEAITRQPAASANITSTMFIGLAMCETAGIYGLLIAIILLFANPLITIYANFVK